MDGDDKQPASGLTGSTTSKEALGLEDASPAVEESSDEFQGEPIPLLRFVLLCIGTSLGLFLAILDSSIVATSLYTIGQEFNSLDRINWVALAYTLPYLSCAVLVARVSDVIGRRAAFLGSYGIFLAFSLGCGFSQTIDQLLAFRALQGLGGSGLYSLTMIILPEITSDRFKNQIATIVGVVIATAGVLGPLLGGVLTQRASWRWVFWINLPIGTLSVILFYFSWPKPEQLPHIVRRTWRELDYVGSFLLLSAAVLVTFSFQNVGSDSDKWRQAIFLAPLIIGLVCWIALFAWEWLIERLWHDSMAAAIPLRLFRNHVYTGAVLNTLFLGFDFYLLIFAFPLRLQVVNEKTSLTAGLMLLPLLGTVAVGSSLGGIFSSKRNLLFETLLVATSLMLIGFGLLTTLSDSVSVEAKALGFLTLVGLGFGMTASGSTIVANVEASIRDLAPAQGIIAQFRILGGSLGIAASTAILGTKTASLISGELSPEALASFRGSGTGMTREQVESIRRAYADAFTDDMKMCAAVTGAAILVTLLTFRRNRIPLLEIRKHQVEEEIQRQRDTTVAKTRLSGVPV